QRLDDTPKLQAMLQRARRMKCNPLPAPGGRGRLELHARLCKLLRNHLTEVAKELRHPCRLLCVCAIIPKQLAVVSDHGATAGCGDDQRFGTTLDVEPPGIDVAPHLLARAPLLRQMVRKSTAAAVVDLDQRD